MRRSRRGLALQLSEDFARWRDDPMTRLVLDALEQAEQAQKAEWDAYSWGGGRVRSDELKETLQELRVRADCYRALREMTFADVAGWMGLTDDE